MYPDREVVTVRSEVLFLAGGGGPHCITQQVPAGTFAPYDRQPVRLLPREQNRLQVFAAAELARRRRARGLLLSQAEAVALISDEVMEAARDGLDYAAVEQRGYEILDPADVLEDVPRLVARIELEALFADGYRLIVLHDPITSGGPPRLTRRRPASRSGWRAAHRCSSRTRPMSRSRSRRTSTCSRPTGGCCSIAGPPGACGWRWRPASRS